MNSNLVLSEFGGAACAIMLKKRSSKNNNDRRTGSPIGKPEVHSLRDAFQTFLPFCLVRLAMLLGVDDPESTEIPEKIASRMQGMTYSTSFSGIGAP